MRVGFTRFGPKSRAERLLGETNKRRRSHFELPLFSQSSNRETRPTIFPGDCPMPTTAGCHEYTCEAASPSNVAHRIPRRRPSTSTTDSSAENWFAAVGSHPKMATPHVTADANGRRQKTTKRIAPLWPRRQKRGEISIAERLEFFMFNEVFDR